MNRARFPKAIKQYELLNVFGKNIVTTDGDEWKHIRKVVAPAFSEVRNSISWCSRVAYLVLSTRPSPHDFSRETTSLYGTRLCA